MNWSFFSFSAWLKSKAESCREEGMVVDLQVQDEIRPSIRLRIEVSSQLGELTVWSDGIAQEMIVDLGTGEFIYERDNIQLDGNWADCLEVFFRQFDGGKQGSRP
jgi:hypothetical protein